MAPTKPSHDIPIGEHPIPERHAYAHDNRLLLTIIAVLLVALVIVGIAAFAPPSDSKAAHQKATQLQQLLAKEGLPIPPNLDVLSASLGTDGGSACASPEYDLTGAILNQQFAAGGAAARPLPIESQILNGQLAIIHVYCPSRAPAFIAHFHDYKLYDLAGQ